MVIIAPKNWKLKECYELRKRSAFVGQTGPKLKKLEGFFLGEEYGELAIEKSE